MMRSCTTETISGGWLCDRFSGGQAWSARVKVATTSPVAPPTVPLLALPMFSQCPLVKNPRPAPIAAPHNVTGATTYSPAVLATLHPMGAVTPCESSSSGSSSGCPWEHVCVSISVSTSRTRSSAPLALRFRFFGGRLMISICAFNALHHE